MVKDGDLKFNHGGYGYRCMMCILLDRGINIKLK